MSARRRRSVRRPDVVLRIPPIAESIVEAGYKKDALRRQAIEVEAKTAPERVLKEELERRQEDVRSDVPVNNELSFLSELQPPDTIVTSRRFNKDVDVEAYAMKIRVPISNEYDDANKMEYGLFLSQEDIDAHINALKEIMNPPSSDLNWEGRYSPQQFQYMLADAFVTAQHLQSAPSKIHEFSWHNIVHPVQASPIPQYKNGMQYRDATFPPSLVSPTTGARNYPFYSFWNFVWQYVLVRKKHVVDFVLPILRSSCSPHCTFQNVGSATLTADIDISVMSSRGGILKYIANYITRLVFTRLGFVERVTLPSGIVVTFDLGDLPSLMDTNVYPTGWYNICNNTNVAPFESCIDQTFFMSADEVDDVNGIASAVPTGPAGSGFSFATCQLMWSMVRLRYAMKYERSAVKPEDGNYFRNIVNLEILTNDASTIPAVEYAVSKLETTYGVDDDFKRFYVDPILTKPKRSERAKSVPYLTEAMITEIKRILIESYKEYIRSNLEPNGKINDAAFNAYLVNHTYLNTAAKQGVRRAKINEFIKSMNDRPLDSKWSEGSNEFVKILTYKDDGYLENVSNKFVAEADERAEIIHKIRSSGKKRAQKVLGFLIQSVESSLRNYQTRTRVVGNIFFSELKQREAKVEEDQRQVDPLLLNRTVLRNKKADLLNAPGGGIFDSTKTFAEDRTNVHARLERAFHYEYFTLQSMLYAFEEEAYFSIGAYLHVVVQEQKGFMREVYLGQLVYWMSFFDNLGFFYETRKSKYFDRMVNAILRICTAKGINKKLNASPSGFKDFLENAVFFVESLATSEGLQRASNGLQFIKSCIGAFNSLVTDKKVSMQGCYRMVLAEDAFEVGDIVTIRGGTNQEFVVTSLDLGRSSTVSTNVMVQEFRSLANGTIELTGTGPRSMNIKELRRKYKGYTIVPEHYTFTNV